MRQNSAVKDIYSKRMQKMLMWLFCVPLCNIVIAQQVVSVDLGAQERTEVTKPDNNELVFSIEIASQVNRQQNPPVQALAQTEQVIPEPSAQASLAAPSRRSRELMTVQLVDVEAVQAETDSDLTPVEIATSDADTNSAADVVASRQLDIRYELVQDTTEVLTEPNVSANAQVDVLGYQSPSPIAENSAAPNSLAAVKDGQSDQRVNEVEFKTNSETDLVPQQSAETANAMVAEGAELSGNQELVVNEEDIAAIFFDAPSFNRRDLIDFDASMPIIASPVARLQLDEWFERISSAKAEHPSVLAARLNEQETASIINEAKSVLTPQVQIGLSYDAERTMRNGERISSLQGLEPTNTPRLNANLSLNQLLFDGGAAFARIDAAKSRNKAAANRRESTEVAISLRAADNLIELAKLQEQLQAARDNLSEVSRLRDMINERVRIGRDSPSEMLQMNTRVYEARNQVVRLLGLRAEAGARHEETFGEPPVILAFPTVFAPIPLSEESAMDVAMRRNPDILNARQLVTAAIAENRAAKADGLPRIEVQARANSFDAFGGGPEYNDAFVGINVSYDLFDGGRKKAISSRTSIAVERVREQNNQVVKDVELALKQAFANRQSLIPRYKSLQAQLDQQIKTREAYEEQFLSGRRPLNDLIGAQQQVLDAALITIESKAQLHRQHFLILALMGDLTLQL